MKLRHIIRAEFIGLMQSVAMPVRIEIHQRRKPSFRKPAWLDCSVCSTQKRARSDDNIARHHRLLRIAHRDNLDSQLPTHLLRVTRGAIVVLVIRINLFQGE